MENPKKLIKSSSYWTNLFKSHAEKTDIEDVLLSMPPFRSLSDKYIKMLTKILHERVYAANESIFLQGDPGIGLYIINRGEVAIVQAGADGKEHELTRLKRGDFFGELAVLDEEVRSASAIAVKESHLQVIFKPDLDDFVERYPRQGIKILQGIAKITARRLRSLNQDFTTVYNKILEKDPEVQNGENTENISPN